MRKFPYPGTVSTGRRLTALLLALLLIGVPAVVLNIACVGQSCAQPVAAKATVPFCPLPDDLRTLLVNGFYKDRSPEVFAVARSANVEGGTGPNAAGAAPIWPYPGKRSLNEVPLILWGDGMKPGFELPAGTGLDQVAPTLASILGFDRGHPEVRAGTPIEGAWKAASPRLLLIIGLKGLGTVDLTQLHEPADTTRYVFPGDYLRALFKQGASTLHSNTQSLPVDSAASLTTMGTGGLPAQHGIAGSLVRNDRGEVVQAWGKDSPTSVITTLADDLDYKMGNRPLVGMVATNASDRGLIGDGWYTLDTDTDPFVVASGAAEMAAVKRMLGSGFGADATPDILGVTLDYRATKLQAAIDQLKEVIDAAMESSGGSLTVAVAGTGEAVHTGGPLTGVTYAGEVVSQVEAKVGAPGAVAAAVPGGLFLDQAILADEQMPAGQIVQALKSVTDPKTKQKLMLDAYPAFSVSFARYC